MRDARITTGGGEGEGERSDVRKCLSLIPICNYCGVHYNPKSFSTFSSPHCLVLIFRPVRYENEVRVCGGGPQQPATLDDRGSCCDNLSSISDVATCDA